MAKENRPPICHVLSGEMCSVRYAHKSAKRLSFAQGTFNAF